jgi:hypothetical protein
MMKLIHRLLPAVLGLGLAASPARANSLYFIEQNGNYSWFSAGNWFYYTGTSYVAANTLPAPGDTAIITTSVNAAGNSINVANLTLKGTAVSGGDFTVTSTLTTASGSSFTSSSIQVLSQMQAVNYCTLTGVALTIGAGAILQVTAATGSLLPNELALSGSTIFNSGEIILTDGTSLYGGFNGTTGSILHNFPNAALSGSGATSVQAATGALTFDYSGAILCNYGTLQLPYSLIWTNSQTNVVVFNALATNAIIALNGDFTLPAPMTFIFTGPGLSQLTLDGPTVVLGTLQVGAKDPVSQLIDVGTLEVDVNLVSNGVVHVVAGPGSPSALNWAGSTISQVTINIDAGGLFNLTGLIGQEQLSSATVNNAGTATWTGIQSLLLDGSVFNNLPGAVFNARATNGQGNYPQLAGHASFFNNAGTFRTSVTTNDIDFAEDGAPAPGPILVNTGLIDVETGRVLLYGSTNSSQINVAAGAQLRFYANTNTLLAGTSLTGAGTIAFGGGTATVILATNITVPSLIADDESAVVKGPGNLVISGSFNWLAGTLQGPGALWINPGASLTVNSGYPPTLHCALNNAGSTTLAQGTPLNAGNGAIVNNLSSGLFVLQPGSAIDYDNTGALPVFINAGLLENTPSSSVRPSLALTVTNTGAVLIQSNGISFGAYPPGTIYTQTAGSTVIAAGATMQADNALNYATTVFLQGGTLSGSGTMDGYVTNSGAVVRPGSAPGILTVAQGYLYPYGQGPGGTLSIELGGLTAGTQFDQLNNGGYSYLGGTLNVSLINGFQPAVGESFPIVLFAGTGTGKFSTLNVPAGISVNYSNAGVYLVVTGTVPVQVIPPQLAAGAFNFGFGTVNNQNYTIQSTTNLAAPNWILYSNFTGSGSLMNLALPVTNAQQQYFRVLEP